MRSRRHAPLLLGLLALVALVAPLRAQADPGALIELVKLFGGEEPGVDGERAREPERPPATPLGSAGNTGFETADGENFELHARNLDVAEAFAQLRQLVRRNIVVAPTVDARFTGDLYGVTADEAVEVVCRSTGLVARDEGHYIYVEPAIVETRIFELDHARAADLIPMVTPLLSEGGSVSSTVPAEKGIESSQVEAGGDDYAARDILVVSDLPDVLDRVAQIVARVDAEPEQVLIEATILSAQLTDDMQMGIQFSALSGLDWNDVTGESPDGFGVDYGPIGGDELTDGLSTFGTNLAESISTGGMNVGFIKNGVGAFVRAVSAVTQTTLLANPRILTLNKQRGEVLLGRRDGFLTTTVTQTAATQSVEYLETGTRLVFRPFITSNGLVRLEVHPEDSDGGVNADGLPFKSTAEITTNVMVRSGDTVVIGGLFREREQVVERQVPFLGSIPLLGWLFRSEQTLVLREEIIILLTPRIEGFGDDEDDPLAGSRPPWEFTELVDTRLLAGSYLEAARLLDDDTDLSAATYMVDLAGALEGGVREVRDLRRLLWNQRIPPVHLGHVDHALTRRMLSTEATP